MKLALVAFSLMLAMSGCTRSDLMGGKAEPAATPAATPRFFDEKVRCATVGERWEKVICSRANGMMCVGYWAYNAKRDTCVGVFTTSSFLNKGQPQPFQTLSVIDLLTGLELEETCGAAHCDVEGAKARWILGQDKQ